MIDQIENLLKTVVIPGTEELFQARLKLLNENEGLLNIHYNRDGLELDAKKKLEEALYAALENKWDENKIRIMSISSQEETSNKPPKEEVKTSAQLKTGHGPAGQNKKRVSGVKKVIAISSGKGGVGKSTVTANLAVTLARQGFKVGVIDADIYGPSLPMLFGKREEKPRANDAKKIIPIEAHGIHFISFGLFVGENEPVIWRGPMLGGVLNQFLFDVDWDGFDFLLLDLPPGTGDMQLSMIQATEVDGVVVVSTPQNVALLDSTKGLEMFRQVKVPILGMIENMSYFVPQDDTTKKYYIFGESGVKKTAQKLEVDFLGELPLEIALRESSDEGVPYMTKNEYEGRPVWLAYNKLAEKVVEKLGVTQESKKGFFKNLFK